MSDGRDTIRGIEKLQFNGSVLNVIEGTDAGEVLNGTSQADLLVGKGGGDVLNGGDGNDILIGGTNPVATTVTFADNFDAPASYTDNNGSADFTGGWTESGGLTNGDVADRGQIRISGNSLPIPCTTTTMALPERVPRSSVSSILAGSTTATHQLQTTPRQLRCRRDRHGVNLRPNGSEPLPDHPGTSTGDSNNNTVQHVL